MRYAPLCGTIDYECGASMSTKTSTVKPKITYDELLGRVIEHRRRQLGVLQAPIAEALEVTQSAYSRLEKGQSAMSVSQLRTVASHVGTSSAGLLDEVERYADQFRRQGGEIIREKQDSTAAALLIAFGVLAAILAAKK